MYYVTCFTHLFLRDLFVFLLWANTVLKGFCGNIDWTHAFMVVPAKKLCGVGAFKLYLVFVAWVLTASVQRVCTEGMWFM